MNRVLAQTVNLPGGKSATGPLDNRFSSIGGVVSDAIPYVFGFAGLALLLILVRGGFTFLTSAGDPKKLEMGKQQLTYALVGFLLIFSSFWIVQLVGRILGFTEITSVFQ
ncbi:hypothetical protein HY410_01795 [Candidatus Gottesmanbacteria bacterium]|nr:hypothetical protein [Candidatus Gottesmanbacteria bacterium]